MQKSEKYFEWGQTMSVVARVDRQIAVFCARAKYTSPRLRNFGSLASLTLGGAGTKGETGYTLMAMAAFPGNCPNPVFGTQDTMNYPCA